VPGFLAQCGEFGIRTCRSSARPVSGLLLTQHGTMGSHCCVRRAILSRRSPGMPEAGQVHFSWVGYEVYLPRTRSIPEKNNSNL